MRIAQSCPGTHTALQMSMLLTPQSSMPKTTRLCTQVTNTMHSWQSIVVVFPSCLVGFSGFHPYMCLFSIENFLWLVYVQLCGSPPLSTSHCICELYHGMQEHHPFASCSHLPAIHHVLTWQPCGYLLALWISFHLQLLHDLHTYKINSLTHERTQRPQ